MRSGASPTLGSDDRTKLWLNPSDHPSNSTIQLCPAHLRDERTSRWIESLRCRIESPTGPSAEEHREIDTPHDPHARKTATRIDRQLLLHLAILLVVSIGFESLFINHGLSAMDEGWPLHAAMELHDSGASHGTSIPPDGDTDKKLYDEVFWVFPPGHLLPAWIAYELDPPGIVLTRIFYAAFTVAAWLALLFVARRMMPSEFALLGVLLIAVAAPESHQYQLLFGYRYLVWAAIVLLFFHLRLSRDDARWLFPAGLFAGIALFFRLTPAFAVSVGIGVGIMAASRSWQRWFRDGLWYSAGLILVWIPILLWFQGTVGLETFWSEMVVRPVEMTALQSLPIPPILLENLNRTRLTFSFASLGFRLYPLLYVGLLASLLYRWARAFRDNRPFESVYLLTFVVFGAVYFARSMGRSDMPHLDSALPPIAILLAYCASLSTKLKHFDFAVAGRRAGINRLALCVVIFAAWTFATGSDRYLDTRKMMGGVALENMSDTIKVRSGSLGMEIDKLIPIIQEHSQPDDTILVMAHSPLIYVVAERHSPGFFDVIMPGTFRDPKEQRDFLEHLKEAPPAVIVVPRQPFDNDKKRGLRYSAPLLRRWVGENYRAIHNSPRYRLLVPIEAS